MRLPDPRPRRTSVSVHPQWKRCEWDGGGDADETPGQSSSHSSGLQELKNFMEQGGSCSLICPPRKRLLGRIQTQPAEHAGFQF